MKETLPVGLSPVTLASRDLRIHVSRGGGSLQSRCAGGRHDGDRGDAGCTGCVVAVPRISCGDRIRADTRERCFQDGGSIPQRLRAEDIAVRREGDRAGGICAEDRRSQFNRLAGNSGNR